MKTGLNRQEQNKFKRDVKAGMTLKECEKIYALTKKTAKSWFDEFAPKAKPVLPSGSTKVKEK